MSRKRRRPTYETNSDRLREGRVMARVSAVRGTQMVAAPKAYQIDWFEVCPTTRAVVGFHEFKGRNYTWADIATKGGYLLSAHKWLFAKRLSRDLDLPAIIWVEDKEGDLRYLTVGRDAVRADRVLLWGRKDRGDQQDIEPAVVLPVHLFESWKE